MWDVFLLDSDFTIEQPKRYYRQGLNLLHPDTEMNEEISVKTAGHSLEVQSNPEHSSVMGTIKSRVSRILHIGGRHGHNANGDAAHDSDGRSSHSSSNASSASSSRPPTPLLDPSTNTNPLTSGEDRQEEQDRAWDSSKKKGKRTADVSKHTFFISNSQMKLKLFAKNEVCC